MWTTIVALLSCVPRRNIMCTREFVPVCGNGTTFGNRCLAESAGFYDDCAQFLKEGDCTSINTRLVCASDEFASETGVCVKKPWSDFKSCDEEKRQGACPNGNDPNPFVGEHCKVTCGVFERTSITNDGP